MKNFVYGYNGRLQLQATNNHTKPSRSRTIQKNAQMQLEPEKLSTHDVANNSRARQAKELIKISPHDFQLEVGLGIQFFFQYFIFAPEIKFSQGLGNTLIYNNELNESRVLEKVLSRAFTISFVFEG